MDYVEISPSPGYGGSSIDWYMGPRTTQDLTWGDLRHYDKWSTINVNTHNAINHIRLSSGDVGRWDFINRSFMSFDLTGLDKNAKITTASFKFKAEEIRTHVPANTYVAVEWLMTRGANSYRHEDWYDYTPGSELIFTFDATKITPHTVVEVEFTGYGLSLLQSKVGSFFGIMLFNWNDFYNVEPSGTGEYKMSDLDMYSADSNSDTLPTIRIDYSNDLQIIMIV